MKRSIAVPIALVACLGTLATPLLNAQRPPAKATTVVTGPTMLDCRGKLRVDQFSREPFDTEALVSIFPDERRVTYDGMYFNGDYGITKFTDTDIVFGVGTPGALTISAGVNRYTGTLIINTADQKSSGHFSCKPAKQLF